MITAEFSQDVADMRRAEQSELRRAGYAGEIAAVLLEAEPTCEYCGRPEESAVDGDWNGDTGCHISCEEGVIDWIPCV